MSEDNLRRFPGGKAEQEASAGSADVSEKKRNGGSDQGGAPGSKAGWTDGKFEHTEIDIDQDDQTKKALARMAETEERNANI